MLLSPNRYERQTRRRALQVDKRDDTYERGRLVQQAKEGKLSTFQGLNWKVLKRADQLKTRNKNER